MFLLDLLLSLLAFVGVAAIVLAILLSRPLKPPPPLASILDGALQIEADGLPELSRFQARDGTWLAYRRYPAAAGASAIGSSSRPRLGRRVRPDERDRAGAGERRN